MTTTTTIPIPVLEIGTWIRADGFSRAYQLNGVRAESSRYGDDADAAWERAASRGHDTAWAINAGAALTNEPMARKLAKLAAERTAFEGATLVKSGAAYVIEGALQRCTVHGERFSDCIVFKAI